MKHVKKSKIKMFLDYYFGIRAKYSRLPRRVITALRFFERQSSIKLKVSIMVRAIFSNLKKVQARKIYLRACTFFKLLVSQAFD